MWLIREADKRYEMRRRVRVRTVTLNESKAVRVCCEDYEVSSRQSTRYSWDLPGSCLYVRVCTEPPVRAPRCRWYLTALGPAPARTEEHLYTAT